VQKKLNTISTNQKVATKGKAALKAVHLKGQANNNKKVIALAKANQLKVGTAGKVALLKPAVAKGKLAVAKPLVKGKPALAQVKTAGK